MRNLKKILALVLALVMSLSLMATAGASSFSDVSADNPYADAIDVLDQLKVFQGFEDGTFKPTDTLNRAQAAVLVYRIATGDVEGKYVDNYTYMAQSKFVDLDGYNWAKGYINYCQNAEIVVGTDATHFAPGAKVTGYQLLVMLLRTLGYGKAGEFSDPKGWELQTATIAEREGITKNITAGDFGAAAPRQMVAEILFRGLLTPTVEYTALNGYAKGETLGKKNLGLEEIEGIVVANEYANLDANKTLGSGKTLLRTETRDYTLNVTSTLDDIGEYRCTYVIPAAGSRNNDLVCTGLFGDEANKTWETTDDEKVTDSGISTDSKTEKFINFGDGTTYDTSDYRIKYVLTYPVNNNPAYNDLVADHAGHSNCTIKLYDSGDNDKTDTANNNITPGWYATVEHVFRPKTTISSAELGIIEEIFAAADASGTDETLREFIEGEVYVGTQSYKDISDTISYDEFLETYIKTNENAVSVTANDKGNWLKVIDNNNDGVAEYVFKVVYTFAQVEKAKDGAATALDIDKSEYGFGKDASSVWADVGHQDDDINVVDGEDIVCDEELVAGDIVYYALIDGKIQAYKAEIVPNVKIDKVDRSKLTATVKDGETYTQSEVHEHIWNPDWRSMVRNFIGQNVSWDLYLDRGGYLGAFVKSELGGEFVLLTDGWFMAQRGGDEYAAKVYDRETKEQVDTDITSGGSRFILNNDDTSKNNSWGLLKAFGNNATGAIGNVGALNNDNGTGDEVRTIVAALDEEGNLRPVDDSSVYTRSIKRMVSVDPVDGKYVVPVSKYTKGDVFVTGASATTAYDTQIDGNSAGITSGSAKAEIRALSSTVYYFVYDIGAKKYLVEEYVGYGDLPKYDAVDIEDVYAVGTLVTRDSGYHDQTSGDSSAAAGNDGTVYYTADVVVVEFKNYRYAAEKVFLYDTPVVGSDVLLDEVQIIGEDGAARTVTIDVQKSKFELQSVALNTNTALESDSNTALGAGGISYSPALTQRVMPGLYNLYKTATEGVYTIENMTRAEIAKSNFVLGQVATIKNTGAQHYTDIALWNWDENDISGEYAQSYIKSGAQQYADGLELTDDTKYYTLSYGRTSDNLDRTASLTDPSTWDVALAELVNTVRYDTAADMREALDYSGTRTGLNNDVLALVKNGSVVYAVSLANLLKNDDYVDYDYATGSNKYDFAQLVWQYMLPEAPAATSTDAPTVTFYGVGDKTGDVADPANSANDQDPTVRTIEVKYGVASKAAAKTIVVTPVGDNAIVGVEIESVSGTPGTTPGIDTKAIVDATLVKNSADGTWTYTVSPEMDETMTYTVRVYYSNGTATTSQEWTLQQDPADVIDGNLQVSAALAAAGVSVDDGNKALADDDTDNTPDAVAINITKLGDIDLDDLALGLTSSNANETLKFKMVDADGNVLFNEIDPEDDPAVRNGLSMTSIGTTTGAATGARIQIQVTNTDGREATLYLIVTNAAMYTVSNADGDVLATALEGDTVALDATTLDTNALKGYFTLKNASNEYFDGTNWGALAAGSYLASDDGKATDTPVDSFTMPASDVTLEDDYWKLSTGYQESTTDMPFFKAGENVTIEDDASQSALGLGWVTLTAGANVIGSDAVLNASAATATFTALAAPATGDEYTVDVAQAKVILHNMQDANTANDVTKYVDVADAATGLTLATGDVSGWYTTDANSAALGDAFADNGTATIANLVNTGACTTHINYGYYKITINDANSTVKKTDISITASDTTSKIVSNDIYTTGSYTITNSGAQSVYVGAVEITASGSATLTATADGTITFTDTAA